MQAHWWEVSSTCLVALSLAVHIATREFTVCILLSRYLMVLASSISCGLHYNLGFILTALCVSLSETTCGDSDPDTHHLTLTRPPS